MKEYILPYFGNFQINKLKNDYSIEVEYDHDEILIELFFENPMIDSSRMDKVKSILEDIPKYDLLNKKHISDDFSNLKSTTIKDYLEDHLYLIKAMDLPGFENINDTVLEKSKELLKHMKLERIAIFPEEKSNFAIFDYSIGPEYSDYIVAACLDENGNFEMLAVES